MGDLAHDTAVRARGEGCYEATLSPDWEIWGPMGGYVAACALRAAGASTPDLRPASFTCQFLNAARLGTVDIRVSRRKQGRSATAERIEITQADRPILDAMVWGVGDVEGLEHDESRGPEVPGPESLPDIRDLLPDEAEPVFPFWNNFEARPLVFEVEWPPDGPRPASWQEWLRFVPGATFDDPWVDACRSVILVDLPSWPSASRPHAWTHAPQQYVAPTLDLTVSFLRPAIGHEWLLCDGAAPVSANGLFGWNARVWSPGGQLHATGGGQCMYRRLPAPS